MSATTATRQAELGEFERADENQCAAIAEHSGERCQRTSIAGTPYCNFHITDLDVESALS